jgi:hypothetical protein
MDMAETPDGIFIVFIPCIPNSFEVHVWTEVDHSKGPCGRTKIEEP